MKTETKLRKPGPGAENWEWRRWYQYLTNGCRITVSDYSQGRNSK